MDDEKPEGIRGTELADEAPVTDATPPEELAKDGVRGDGLATGAEENAPPPDPDEVAENSIRGDGLAK